MANSVTPLNTFLCFLLRFLHPLPMYVRQCSWLSHSYLTPKVLFFVPLNFLALLIWESGIARNSEDQMHRNLREAWCLRAQPFVLLLEDLMTLDSSGY